MIIYIYIYIQLCVYVCLVMLCLAVFSFLIVACAVVIAGVAGASFTVLWWGLAHFWDGASVNAKTCSFCWTCSNYDRTSDKDNNHQWGVAFWCILFHAFDGCQNHILLLFDRMVRWAPATSPHLLRSWIWCSLPSAMLASILTGADSSRSPCSFEFAGNLMFSEAQNGSPEGIPMIPMLYFVRSQNCWPGGSHHPGYTPWASACLSPGSGGNNVPGSPRGWHSRIP